ncbi:MAG: LCP family protein [Acutalibacteraceae bacterium]|nr:LCP family protein [Oscillospiraceae bacterium]
MKRSVGQKAFLAVGAAIVLIIAVGYGIFYHYYSMMNYQKEEDSALSSVENETDADLTDSDGNIIENVEELIENNKGSVEELFDSNVYNILFIGTDSRGSERGRSDAMILFSINSKTRKLVLTSFLRDIYLYIPSVGNNRLNAAYAYGGASLLMKTIKQNFGITVNNYAQTDFFSFIKVIDALGGVTLTVTAAEIKQINHNLKEINKLRGLPSGQYALSASQAGSVHLNGSQTLAYARIRYIGTDFGRTERQRKVLSALITSFKSASVKQLISLMTNVLPLVSTNLKQGDILKLISNSGAYAKYSVTSQSIPASGTYSFVTIRKMSVISIDFQKNTKILKDTIYG